MRAVLLSVVALSLYALASAQAEIDPIFSFNPQLAMQPFALEHASSFFGTSDGENGADDFGLREHGVVSQVPAFQSESQALFLAPAFYWLSIDNDDNFPVDNVRTPTDLYDVSAGAAYYLQTGGNFEFVLPASVGSATPSGDLFKSTDEMFLSALPFVRIGEKEDLRFIALADFDSRRDQEIFPGIGVQLPIGDGWAAFGFPFASINAPIGKPVDLSLSYRAERNAKLRLRAALNRSIAAFLGFTWQERFFLQSETEDDSDRTVYEDKRVLGGIQFRLSKWFRLGLHGGWAFDREFGQGSERSERHANGLEIDDTWFTGFEFAIARE